LSAALALGALFLYVPALVLPMLRIEELGHVAENSLLSGVVAMLGEGHLLVGVVVLMFSIVFPFVKLLCLLVLGSRRVVNRSEHRAVVYRAVDAVGRWGMLDVMLVAVLLAYVKLGDMLAISPGPGVAAFCAMVVLSLMAGMAFQPHVLWDDASGGRS
jgi:paraquat-inducible protein A